jgi:ABC-type multidrug transport system fused ATPase/permease subunit
MKGPKVENPGKIFKRLMAYVLKRYGIHYSVVILCIFGSVFASVQGTLFTRTLIDDYIVPMIGRQNPDFTNLLHAILRVGSFYMIGIVCAFVQARVMAYVTQGCLKMLRDDMFAHMEKLPVKYFDTHAHGDIMSLYTNDIDTLRQMVSQSIPQMINSVVTVVSVFISMVMLSVPLTALSVLMVLVVMFVAKSVAGKSGGYFVKQQQNVGAVNGYIEEMMDGQKVIKVFCHEDKSLEEFKRLNNELFDSANNANKLANSLGPINAQLSNVSYVICALAGGLLAITIPSLCTASAALSAAGLPVTAASAINVCDYAEVKTLIDILSLIDNAEQDVPLCSALLSAMGDLTADDDPEEEPIYVPEASGKEVNHERAAQNDRSENGGYQGEYQGEYQGDYHFDWKKGAYEAEAVQVQKVRQGEDRSEGRDAAGGPEGPQGSQDAVRSPGDGRNAAGNEGAEEGRQGGSQAP